MLGGRHGGWECWGGVGMVGGSVGGVGMVGGSVGGG